MRQACYTCLPAPPLPSHRPSYLPPACLLLLLLLLLPAGMDQAPVFTVPQMADFLFNSTGAASCAAALRLLRDDRLYFKQASAARPGRVCLLQPCPARPPACLLRYQCIALGLPH